MTIHTLASARYLPGQILDAEYESKRIHHITGVVYSPTSKTENAAGKGLSETLGFGQVPLRVKEAGVLIDVFVHRHTPIDTIELDEQLRTSGVLTGCSQ